MTRQSLIPLLGTILSDHREWFETKGNSGVFADLSEENLEEGNFENTVLVEAKFQGSNLHKSNFRNSDLRGANFHDARLTQAQFQNSNLEETDLMWADLKGANFDNVRLAGAYLQGADLRETNIKKDQIQFSYTDEDTLLPNNILNKKI